MKTTIDIPDHELMDAIRFTGAKTNRHAVITTISDFNRRRRMSELLKYAGTCADMYTLEELQSSRRQDESSDKDFGLLQDIR